VIDTRVAWRWVAIVAVPLALVAGGSLLDASGAFAVFRFAVSRAHHDAPSARALPAEELSRGVATVSLYVRPRDLTGRLRGLLANPRRSGSEWERPGWVSFFEQGRLVHSAPAGVRVHGGSSREQRRPQGFRLYFRRESGARELPGAVAFGDAHAHPLRRLVLHNDYRDRSDRLRWQFMNPLAYDIARAIGALAPPARPVRFVLNGEFQGVYVVTEHLHPRDYFEAHPGYRMRATHDEINALWPQVRAIRPLRARTLAPLVDVDNLTRWFIAVVFCATGDAYQEPGVFRDPTRAAGQWFWVNWDMDASFRDPAQDSFPALLSRTGQRRARRHNDPRPYILTTLLDEDADYRASFMRTWTDVMNHVLTPAFLDERYRHYERLAVELGVEDRRFLVSLRRFLTERPRLVWTTAETWLQTGAAVGVQVTGDRPIRINGHLVSPGWEGQYFPGMRLEVAASADDVGRSSRLLVNGQVVTAATVTVPGGHGLQIAALD
jgi:hypothetical protein